MVTAIRIAAALAWLLPWCVAAASGALSLHVDRTNLEFGQGIAAQLHYTDTLPRPTVGSIRTALARDFAVDAGDTAQVGQHAFVQHLTLYPRHAGKLVVPALRAGDQHTAPVTIHVAVAQEAGHSLQVHTMVDTADPWVRQQVKVIVEVSSADPFFGLELRTPQLPGFEVIPIPMQQRKETRGNVRYTVKTVGWLLYPLRDGTFKLELPPVGYVRNGLAVRRFYPPPTTLHVKPLPPYVPPLMPVGAITAHTRLTPAGTLRTGRLAYWNVDIEGADVPADWLPPVLAQIRSNRRLQVFPAESTHRDRPDADGVHGRIRHRIPLKPLASGREPLPRLRLQYFDPDTGRIVPVTTTPERPLALSLPVLILLALLLAVLFGWLARLFGRRVAVRWQRYRLRRQALARLHDAADPDALRFALRLFALAEGWPTNLTLSAWLERWRHDYRLPGELTAAIAQLSGTSYGARPTEPQLRARLISCLRRPRRRRIHHDSANKRMTNLR